MVIDELQQKANSAVKLLNTLWDLHDNYINLQESVPLIDQFVGKYGVKDKKIVASCFKNELEVTWRPVVGKDGLPDAMEYSFSISLNDDDQFLFLMYLDEFGVFFRDHDFTIKLWDFMKDYPDIPKQILYLLADEMLKSAIFAPLKPYKSDIEKSIERTFS